MKKKETTKKNEIKLDTPVNQPSLTQEQLHRQTMELQAKELKR
jgi:hypothetical protein